jgi:hypothetical protein
VRGPVPFNGTICTGTRNRIDNGIQCSPSGPDAWHGVLHYSIRGHTPPKIKLTNSMTGFPNMFVLNNTFKRQKRKTKSILQLNNTDTDHLDKEEAAILDDVHMWHKPPRRVPANDQSGLIIVVQDDKGMPLSSTAAAETPSPLQDSLNCPSIKSANDISSPLQTFFPILSDEYEALCSMYSDGMSVSDNYEEEIDKELRYFCTETFSLVSTDKLPPPNNFYGFTRIFAGDGSPDIDSSFTPIQVNNLSVNYKYTKARECTEYPPISSALNDKSFHGIQISDQDVSLINKAVGSGTYGGSGRNTMLTSKHSQLSYLGPRKCGDMNKPTVSEGPKDTSVLNHRRFWFTREKIKHTYWPYVLRLFNAIVGSTTLAPYLLYPHLRHLYPIMNTSSERKKFCPRGIITIDFCCSCHTDNNDKERDEYFPRIRDRLINICRKFEELLRTKVYVTTARYQEAVQALKHVKWWKVSIPTTCCYQYIKKCNDIQVYQFFMCPGLGTCYRIKNYWVHTMLAGLFSHCTSVPIYIVDGKAYFGKCPYVKMFAWGGN